MEGILVQRQIFEKNHRTYSSSVMARQAPKELGNVEETERLFVAKLVVAKLHPQANPYALLEEKLAQKGAFRTRRAIQMRIRRFEKFLDSGQFFSTLQVVEQHYSRFKHQVVMNERKDLWAKAPVPLPARQAHVLARLTALTKLEGRMLEQLCS